jgi:hypothetical protein
MGFVDRVFGALVLSLCFPIFGLGQQSTSEPRPAAQDSPQQESEREIERKEQSQRILGVVPMFGVTSRQDAPPLTTAQKARLTFRQALDPFQYVAVGLQAGVAQATNQFPGYGQGAAGYGMRYGATLGDEISSQFFSNFFYPVLLKEDPRYFRSGQGTVKLRIGYSLAQEFVAHTDAGGRSFNWSNVLGAATTGGLSNAYYPPSDRGFSLTMSRTGIALLYGAVGGLVDEFWPDIRHKVFHRPETASNRP